MSNLKLSVLPAGDGDCFILSWGQAGEVRHAVIDGGRSATYSALRPRLVSIADANEPFELLVLTHIDADHIEGSLRQVTDPSPPLVPRRVWYNSFDALGGMRILSEAQGDRYAAKLAELCWPVNHGFDNERVAIETAPEDINVAGLKVRILSPDAGKVEKMRKRWSDWREDQPAWALLGSALSREPLPDLLDVDALAVPGPIDREAPNGSSIAMLVEFEGRRLLLAGDAHPDLLARSIAPLAEAEGGRLRIDLFKVSHHGSRGNVTPELVEMLDCRRFLISTDGTRHGHPDPEAIARLLKFAPAGSKELLFNYSSARTQPWKDDALMHQWDYNCIFPDQPGHLEISV